MGVTLSPRAARFYTWLNECGVGLTSFSTDVCVAAAMPRLEAAHGALLSMMLSEPGADWPAFGTLDQVLGDLETLMRRTPANRVPASNAGRW
jgi:hypothetical protein